MSGDMAYNGCVDMVSGFTDMIQPMKNFLTLVLTAVAFSSVASLVRAEGETPLPFSVSIGGQAAQAKSGEPNFARVEKPVAANAALEVGAKASMIIVNVTVADENGVPKEGATPAVIIIQGGNKTTLDKTMDGKKLAPGNYLLAAVADENTASVFFQIQ